jgi:hypothetical protein
MGMDATRPEQFRLQLGMAFQPEGAAPALTLIKVESQPVGFILMFQGPAKPVLAEGQYEFAVEDGTACAFHVMPIHTPMPGHQDYQAIFN